MPLPHVPTQAVYATYAKAGYTPADVDALYARYNDDFYRRMAAGLADVCAPLPSKPNAHGRMALRRLTGIYQPLYRKG